MGMKRRTMLGLAASLPLLAATSASAQGDKGMDALECIHTRRSIRKYLDKPVPDELVDKLLQAAMTAPSALNEQPWRFVVVSDREKLKAASEAGARPAAGAAVGILVCAEPGAVKGHGFWPLDCSNATMNILLAANALGLGAVWTASYPEEKRMEKYTALFNLPPTITPFAFVCLGWPEKPGWRENRFKPEWIKRDSWV